MQSNKFCSVQNVKQNIMSNFSITLRIKYKLIVNLGFVHCLSLLTSQDLGISQNLIAYEVGTVNNEIHQFDTKEPNSQKQ